MPIQAPQWTEFLSCPVCCNEFAANLRPPISLGCGHTICRTCLATLHRKQCPFDQTIITTDLDNLPVNNALLQLVSTSNTAVSSPGNNGNGGSSSSASSSLGSSADPDLCSPSVQNLCPDDLQCYKIARGCIEELALYLKPYPNGNAGGLLSRPMQRKLVTLVNCQLIEDEGRARSLRAARSLGERTVTELILQHQNPQQLSTNLWAAVRARGCQFLGPAMQEEVLKLVLLALEDGSALSRKVLVMFVVQRLEPHFPQASKTSIGHVVQLLYRASCFKVSKREGDSSLMQLKEEFRTYEALRREHDAQIVQIATEAGLRIAPDQWSSLLYGDTAHKSHMQSIIDKLQTPQSFVQSVQELIIALQRTGDPANLSGLRMHLKHLAGIDSNAENHVPTWRECSTALEAVKRVVIGLVDFVQHHGNRKLQEPGHLAHNSKYKISLCRDLNLRGTCPRGPNCTFAHSEEELEKYRTKLRTKNIRTPNGKDHVGVGEYMGDLGMPSGSQHGGYHSSGEEASPLRYPKSTPPMRYLDKSPMSSHSHASHGSSSNSNSSHNSHLAPIPAPPPPHIQPHHPSSYPNVPPQPSPLQQQHGANGGRSFNFNPSMPYGARPPPPPMQPPPSVRGNFIRPPNGNYNMGHHPPLPPMPHNGPMQNHHTYPGSGGQPVPPPQLEQMHPPPPPPPMMNAPPPPYLGQGYPNEYPNSADNNNKMDQRRQFNPWDTQQPPPQQSGHPAPPPVNMMGHQTPKSYHPQPPPPSMMGKVGHMPPPPPQHHPLPQQQQQPPPPSLAPPPPQQHQQQSHPNAGKFYPTAGNGPLHHHVAAAAAAAKQRDYREKHHNGGRHIPPHGGHSQQQHQPPPVAAYGNGNRSSMHTPLPQNPTQATPSSQTSNGGTMMNGYHGGSAFPFNRSEAQELFKILGSSNAAELAQFATMAGAVQDKFVRSDSLLADDDLVIPENDYSSAGGTVTGAKFGPISRMTNNLLGSGAGKQRGEFPFASSLLDADWLQNLQHHLYNDSLGEQSSSNCSSTSSSFYQNSHPNQQQQQLPVSAAHTNSKQHEPNNNTLDLDLFQVDRKLADYGTGADNQSNVTSQLLHHHQQQQQQQSQHHPHHTMAAAAAALLSSHHHHQQQQQQQFAQQHAAALQQQQQHVMQKLQSVLADPVQRFNDLMVNGGGGGVQSELKIHSLKDLKAQQTMSSSGLSPVVVVPTSSSIGGGVSSGSPSSASSGAVPPPAVTSTPLWNNLFDLSGMKQRERQHEGGDLVGGATSSSDSGNLSGSTAGLNSSTTSSSMSNSHNCNNNEDSYEAGIADDMRELALRLESELNIN
uniref:RING-type E3 ubiquitin transferase n=2 Tax=Culex pipiens TaxID=7175 RepID=A0A8D8CW58_CULPI